MPPDRVLPKRRAFPEGRRRQAALRRGGEPRQLKAVQTSQQLELLATAQHLPDDDVLGRHTDGAPDPASTALERFPVDLDHAGVGGKQAAEHLQSRSLAGAVWAEEAEHLASPHLE